MTKQNLTLKLEAIGDHQTCIPGIKPRQWVAEVVGFDMWSGFKREFLKGKKDYLNANSVGSRGVYVYYILEPHKVYDVKQPMTWSTDNRYYCEVVDGEIIRLSESEVSQCLRSR
jgi:hypothetical protein